MSIDPTLTLLVLALATLIAGVAKGGFGGSMVLVSVPLASLVVSPAVAAAILLPILCIMDSVTAWNWRRDFSLHHISILFPSTLIGIGIGTLAFEYVPEQGVQSLIGIIVFSFLIMKLGLGRHLLPSWVRSISIGATWSGRILGGLSGFTSMLVHAGGPTFHMYLLQQKLNKAVFQGTIAVCFLMINFVKLIPYSMLGLLSFDNLKTSLILLPVAISSCFLGIYLHRIVPENVFFGICYVFLGLGGLNLLLSGLGLSTFSLSGNLSGNLFGLMSGTQLQ